MRNNSNPVPFGCPHIELEHGVACFAMTTTTTPESTSLVPVEETPRYENLADVPDTLRTKESWKKESRKVRKGVRHRAEVKWPDSEFSYDKLYAIEDTQVIKVAEAERWQRLFWRLFVQDHNHSAQYIWWSRTKSEWVRVTSRPNPEATGCKYKPPYLRRGDLRNHFSGLDIYGVFGGKHTWWVSLDLDRHDKDKKPATPAHTSVFLEQFRILQAELFGKDNWHFQVKDSEAEGIHCFQVFSQRRDRAAAVQELRDRLILLEARHPKLAARAEPLGMRSFATLEIYPDLTNGFRLPLARGRTMLLDRPLALVPNRRRRMVQDVAGYLSWLLDPQKTYMSADEVYQYLEKRLKPTDSSITPKPGSSSSENTLSVPASAKSISPQRRGLVTSSLPHKLRGRYRQTMIDYWESRLVVSNSLDAMILVTARILPFQNEDEDEGVQVLNDLVDGLTDLSVSSRLGSAKGRSFIDKTINQAARLVYRIDPSTESDKLCKVASAFHAPWLPARRPEYLESAN